MESNESTGKDLSKITMPVVWNEPVSILQRLAESMEYAELLKTAAEQDDPVTRMEYVAAFAVSALSGNWDRLMKPFNPLLGETYELERDNYRLLGEQVSHHPPISAMHVDHELYTLTGSTHPKLRFWGKSVEITPKGVFTLFFKKMAGVSSSQEVDRASEPNSSADLDDKPILIIDEEEAVMDAVEPFPAQINLPFSLGERAKELEELGQQEWEQLLDLAKIVKNRSIVEIAKLGLEAKVKQVEEKSTRKQARLEVLRSEVHDLEERRNTMEKKRKVADLNRVMASLASKEAD
ncbi:unnamed protein product, partial [Notodromas monacha]